MAPRLPPGFISIADAQSKRDFDTYDILGVCTDYLPPAQSRGSSMTMKLMLWDPSCLDTPALGSDGMVIRFFADKMCQFPPVQEIGDVVIVRHLRTKSQGSQWFGLSNPDTKWSVIPGNVLLVNDDSSLSVVQQQPAYEEYSGKGPRQAPTPDIAELKYAKEILHMKDPTNLRGPPKSTALDQATIIRASGGRPLAMKQKHCLLKDLVDPREHDGYQYVDILGEVRRVFHGRDPVEVQLTDYTENSLLYDYPHHGQDGYISTTNYWPGPWGRMTITVCAWDDHAEHVRQLACKEEIKVGMYVRMKNVQILMDKNGGMMQGNLRGLPGASRSNIEFLRPREAECDENLKSLLQRKRKYNLAMKEIGIGFNQGEVTTAKRKAADDSKALAEQWEKKKSKNAKKKERERRAKAEKATGKAGENEALAAATSRSPSNQHVRCEAIEIPLTTISSILSSEQLHRETPAGNPFRLPFQNCKYKSKVQVVDFFPDKLENFATPYRVSDYDALSDEGSDSGSEVSLGFAQNNPDEVQWHWHFFLIVEDPRPTKAQKAPQNIPEQPTMLLQVVGKDGVYLLNMEACNLRNNPQAFATLKEKLFVLWGDLEEKKIEYGKTGQELRDEGVVISSKPFECLVKEYGVSARTKEGRVIDDEWERMFGMIKTSVG